MQIALIDAAMALDLDQFQRSLLDKNIVVYVPVRTLRTPPLIASNHGKERQVGQEKEGEGRLYALAVLGAAGHPRIHFD